MITEPLDIAVFEDEIVRIDKEIEALQLQIINIEKNSSGLQTESDRAKAEKEKYEKEFEEITAKIDQHRASYEQNLRARNKFKSDFTYYTKHRNDIVNRELIVCKRIAEEKAELEVCLDWGDFFFFLVFRPYFRLNNLKYS
jgi:chromosome segregation ATPase